MGGIIKKDFKYKVVKNFLTNEEVLLLKNYTIIQHRKNSTNFDFTQNKVGDTYYRADPIMDSLMLSKQSLMEQETGIKLFPTYSFWRMYTFSSDLAEHKDRAACEISVTVMIGSDGIQWPIFMEDNPVYLEAGDACIYLGCELNHKREEFQGDWQSQVFLHYVDASGPNIDKMFDGRSFII